MTSEGYLTTLVRFASIRLLPTLEFALRFLLCLVLIATTACSGGEQGAQESQVDEMAAAQSQALPPPPSGPLDRSEYRKLKKAMRDLPERIIAYPADDSGPRFDTPQQAAEAIVVAVADDDIERADRILALAGADRSRHIESLVNRRMYAEQDADDYAAAYRLRRFLHFDSLELALELERLDAAIIRGYVREAGSGKPIAGAIVVTNLDKFGKARSASDGSYELTVVPNISQWVGSSHPDYNGPLMSEDYAVKLLPRGEIVVDIELEPKLAVVPRVSVRGQMIDVDSQQPIENMEVYVVPSDAEGLQVMMGRFTAMTDAEGRFEIQDLPRGTHGLLAQKANPYYHHTVEHFEVDGSEVSRRIEARQVPRKKLNLPMIVAGHVHDRDTGQPIANAKVSGGGYSAVRTDDEGKFLMQLAKGKEWHVRASHEEYHQSATQSFSSPDPKNLVVEYLLDPITTGTIVGIAIDAITGEPITNATIKIAGQTVITDREGRFRVKEIEAGDVAVSGGQSGYRADAQTITLEALKTAEARLVLEPITQGSVAGTVVDAATNRTLAGVRVSVAGQTTQTGSDGQFLIEEIEKGDVEISASKAIYERVAMSVEVVAQETATLAMALTPITYGTLNGTIVDAVSGLPLASATVSIAGQTLQTNNAGAFTADKVPAGQVSVTAAYDRYYDASRSITLQAAGDASVKLGLEPITTGTVRGVVTDANSGEPIDGASVNIGRQPTTTNSAGVYVLEKVAAGDIEVAAGATLYEPGRDNVALLAAREVEVDFRLIPIRYGTVSGVVTDASTRQPLSGARISIGDKTAISDAQGAFLFERLSAGNLDFVSRKPVYKDDSTRVRLAAGATENLTIALVPITTGTVSGVVRSKVNGSPLAGVKVSAGRSSVSSDDAGEYRIENVPAGEVQLGAALSLYEPSSTMLNLAAAADVRADLELVPVTYGTISGSVINASTKQAISGAKVASGGKTAVTDGNGKYELQRVSAGHISVTASRPIYIDESLQRELSAGESLTVDLGLQPITWGVLNALVVDADTGEPISGATVTVARQTLTSDARGRFSIEKIDAGTLLITADKPTYNPGSLTLELAPDGSAEATVRLDPIKLGTVHGQVLDAKTGSAIAQARVTTGNKSAETDSSGRFTFENVGIGRVSVAARHADYAEGSDAKVLRGGEAVELLIKLDLRREDVTNLEAALAAQGTIDLYGIYFDSGRDQFKPSSQSTLRAVLEVMKRAPQRHFQIAGHTDSDGAEDSNQDLSERRAATVIAWLADNGIEAGRLDAAGYGEMKPAAPNDTLSGKALNRRVQLSFSN